MPTRKSLIERLKSWYSLQSQDSNGSTKNVAVLSSDKGTGKSFALKELIQGLNTAASTENGDNVVYYEFRGGNLRRDQTACACLLEIAAKISDALGDQARFTVASDATSTATSRKVQQNPYFLDAHTLFLKHIVEPLGRARFNDSSAGPHNAILIIIDGPERCEASSKPALLDILFNCWPNQVKQVGIVKVIIATSVLPDKLFSKSEDRLNQVELITRMSSKGRDADEFIRELFVQAIQSKNVGDDPEWESVKIDSLTKACNGSIFIAEYIITKNLLDRTPSSLPSSIEEICQHEYRSWFGPFLCTRSGSPSSKIDLVTESGLSKSLLMSDGVSKEEIENFSPVLKLLSESNACRDWFFESNKERWRSEGHSASFHLLKKHVSYDLYASTHTLYHGMESGEADLARICLIEFTNLYFFARANLEMLLLDCERYCQIRPRDMTCRVIRNCLVQSKRALAKDSRQLPFQFLARIQGVASDVRGDVEISNLMNACRNFKSSEFNWFKPVRASMALVPETTLKVIRGHADTILSVCTTPLDSPQPKLALTGSCDGTAKLYDLTTGSCHLSLADQGNGYCSGVGLSCIDASLLIALTSTQDGNSRLWYITNSSGYFSCCITGPDGTLVPEFNTPAHILIGHNKELTGCCFMPRTPSLAATCSADKTAKLWELPLPTEINKFPVCKKTFAGHSNPVLCVAFIPENYTMLATGSSDKTIRIWSILGEDDKGTCLSVFSGHFANITCISFRTDGVIFATGGWDSIAKVWNVSEALNQQIADPSLVPDEPNVKEECMLVHRDWIWGVSFVESNRDLLATGADNGIVRLWSIKSQSCILAFDAHLGIGVYCLASVGSDFLVTGGMDSTLRVFDVSKERCAGKNNTAVSWTSVDAVHRHQNRVNCAAFPAQILKRRLCFLASEDKTIRAFDLNTGRCVKTVPVQAPVLKMLVSKDENSIKMLNDRGESTKWNRATVELLPSDWLSRAMGSCCCLDNFGWAESSIRLESQITRDGHFLPPESFNQYLQVSEEEGPIKPFIPLTFDTMETLQCWFTPSPQSFSQGVEGQHAEDVESLDAVVVITERNGLVHVLHPMI